MKKTYKIEERRYSDGSSRFYPKVHDWWHGWRYYADWKVRDWVESEGRIWFRTLDEAREWTWWQIKSDRGQWKARTYKDAAPVFTGLVYHEVGDVPDEGGVSP